MPSDRPFRTQMSRKDSHTADTKAQQNKRIFKRQRTDSYGQRAVLVDVKSQRGNDVSTISTEDDDSKVKTKLDCEGKARLRICRRGYEQGQGIRVKQDPTRVTKFSSKTESSRPVVDLQVIEEKVSEKVQRIK